MNAEVNYGRAVEMRVLQTFSSYVYKRKHSVVAGI
jgi:hypothetical protein